MTYTLPQKDGYGPYSRNITGLCVAVVCAMLFLLGRKMKALQGQHIRHTDPYVLKTGEKIRFWTVVRTVFCVMLVVCQLLLMVRPLAVLAQWIFSKNTSWLDFEMLAIAVVDHLYAIIPLCVIGCLCSLAVKCSGIKARKFGCNTKILRFTDVISAVTYLASVIICCFAVLSTIVYIMIR